MDYTGLFQSTNIFNRTSINRFIDLYARSDNWHEMDKTTGNLGYGWIHYALIRVLQPKRVLCIGSRYGYIPAICALACRDNQKGMVDFVDAGYDQANPKHKSHWGGVGFWNTQEGGHIFEKFNLEHYITMHIMTTQKFKKLYPSHTWSYIHVDGDHSYAGVESDFRFFWPKLTKGGFMAFHDIHTKHTNDLDYGIHQFWQELRLKKIYNMIEFPGTFGLGIIQK
ncbi:MAG: class I SAM-dependent methyltransferase [Patescibacteria group bacterium]